MLQGCTGVEYQSKCRTGTGRGRRTDGEKEMKADDGCWSRVSRKRESVDGGEGVVGEEKSECSVWTDPQGHFLHQKRACDGRGTGSKNLGPGSVYACMPVCVKEEGTGGETRLAEGEERLEK